MTERTRAGVQADRPACTPAWCVAARGIECAQRHIHLSLSALDDTGGFECAQRHIHLSLSALGDLRRANRTTAPPVAAP